MSLIVFLIGGFSIVLLLGGNWINERVRIEEARSDTIMDVQLYAATAHLWLEVAIQGGVEVDVKQAIADLDQAIKLVKEILNGEMPEHEVISEPLQDPLLRSQVEEIYSLLVKFKAITLARLQDPRSRISRALDKQHDEVFREFLEKAKRVNMEIERAAHVISRRIYVSIVVIWTFVVFAAVAILWRIEGLRKRSEDALVNANEQLLVQAEELNEHREHLTDLVKKRTSALQSANRLLEIEISGHKRAEEKLTVSQEELRNISSRLLAAQEDERRRISKELHDELGQSLTLVKFQLRSIERRLGTDQNVLREDCGNILQYLNEIIENVRRLSRDLSPYILEDLGLTRALHWLCDDFKKTYGIKLTMEIVDIDHLFSNDAQTNIYRILQEALTNIVKHSVAANASVSISTSDGGVAFSIADDGTGFDIQTGSVRHIERIGLGLAGMEERVRMLGGVLELRSEKGRGTYISFSVPANDGDNSNEQV